MKYLEMYNKYLEMNNINEVKCQSIENPLAPEIEYEECISAMTFDKDMKLFIENIKKISVEIGQAHSLKSFFERWEKEFANFKLRLEREGLIS